MKRSLALILTGLIGLVTFRSLSWLSHECGIQPTSRLLAYMLVAAVTPASLFLLLAGKLGWLEVREVGSDRLFKLGE